MKSWKSHAQCFPRDKQDTRNWFSSLNSLSVLTLCLCCHCWWYCCWWKRCSPIYHRTDVSIVNQHQIVRKRVYGFVWANINEQIRVFFFFQWSYYFCCYCCCQNEFEIFSSLNAQNPCEVNMKKKKVTQKMVYWKRTILFNGCERHWFFEIENFYASICHEMLTFCMTEFITWMNFVYLDGKFRFAVD